MINRGWAFLGCRLLALYFGFTLVQYTAPSLFAVIIYGGSGQGEIVWLYVFLSLLAGGITLFLWIGATWLSTKLVPGTLATEAPEAPDLDLLLRLAIAFLGVVILAHSIPEAISAIAVGSASGNGLVAVLIEPITKLVIGLVLVFKAGGIGRLLRKIRSL